MDPKAMYGSGEISSASSRRNSIINKMQAAPALAGRAALGAGRGAYNFALGENSPELVKSHRDAASLLLGGPLGSLFLKPLLGKAVGSIGNKLGGIKGGMSPYSMGGDYDVSNAQSDGKTVRGIGDGIEEIEEIFKSDDAGTVKRRARVRRSGKKQTIEYTEKTISHKGNGRRSSSSNSLIRSGGYSGNTEFASSVNKNSLNDSARYGGSKDQLSKKDLSFITHLSKSIAAKLERSEEKKFSTRFTNNTLKFFGETAINLVMPAMRIFNAGRYSSQLPNVKKVGVFAAMNTTLGMIYTAGRATSTETNRLIYDLIRVTQTGLGTKLKVKSPTDVTATSEFVASGLKKIAKSPYTGAKALLSNIIGFSSEDDIKNAGILDLLKRNGGMGGGGNSKQPPGRRMKTTGELFSPIKSAVGKGAKMGGIGLLAALALGVDPMTILGAGKMAAGAASSLLSGGPIGQMLGVNPLSMMMGAGKLGLKAMTMGPGPLGGLVMGAGALKGGSMLARSLREGKLKDTKAGKWYQKSALGSIHNSLSGFRKKYMMTGDDDDNITGGPGKSTMGSGDTVSAEKLAEILNQLKMNTNRDDKYQDKKVSLMEKMVQELIISNTRDKKYQHEILDITVSSRKTERKSFEMEKESLMIQKKEAKEASWWRKWDYFTDAMGGLAGVAIPALQTGIQLISDTVQTGVTAVTGLMGKTLGGLGALLGLRMLTKGAAKELVKGGGLMRFLTKQRSFKGGLDAVKGFGGRISSSAKGMFGGLRDMAGNVGNAKTAGRTTFYPKAANAFGLMDDEVMAAQGKSIAERAAVHPGTSAHGILQAIGDDVTGAIPDQSWGQFAKGLGKGFMSKAGGLASGMAKATPGVVSKVGGAAMKGVTKVVGGATGALVTTGGLAYDIYSGRDLGESGTTAALALGGGAAGGAMGAAIGSVFPIVGTAIGGVIGSVVGALGAVLLDSFYGKQITSTISFYVDEMGIAIRENFTGMLTGLEGIWLSVKEGVTTAVNKLDFMLMGLLDGVVGMVMGMSKGLLEMINTMPEMMITMGGLSPIKTILEGIVKMGAPDQSFKAAASDRAYSRVAEDSNARAAWNKKKEDNVKYYEDQRTAMAEMREMDFTKDGFKEKATEATIEPAPVSPPATGFMGTVGSYGMKAYDWATGAVASGTEMYNQAAGGYTGAGGGAIFDQAPDNLKPLIEKYARLNGLDPNVVAAIIKAESNFNPNAKSPAGAVGLMQLMPGTGKDVNVQPHERTDPEKAIMGGTAYFAKMLEMRGGNLPLALASYNAGPYNKTIQAGQIPQNGETEKYVAKIMGWLGGSTSTARSAGISAHNVVTTAKQIGAETAVKASSAVGMVSDAVRGIDVTAATESAMGGLDTIGTSIKSATSGIITSSTLDTMKSELKEKILAVPGLQEKMEKASGMSIDDLISSQEVTNKLGSIMTSNGVSNSVAGMAGKVGDGIDNLGNQIGSIVSNVAQMSTSVSKSASSIAANTAGAGDSKDSGLTDLPASLQDLLFGQFD